MLFLSRESECFEKKKNVATWVPYLSTVGIKDAGESEIAGLPGRVHAAHAKLGQLQGCFEGLGANFHHNGAHGQ